LAHQCRRGASTPSLTYDRHKHHSGGHFAAALLEEAIARYHSNAITTAEVIQELIKLAKDTCLRWAQLYPSGAPLIAWHEIPAGLQALLRMVENRETARKAFGDDHISGRPLTMPRPPDLQPDEVTG
jgi:hypothetical protein